MTTCPGSCNAAWRATSQGEPVPGDPAWCRPCQARIRRQFAELDYAAALYAMQADGHRELGGEPSRRNGHSPSPSPAMDTVEELTRFLLSWEDAYHDYRGLPSAIRHGYLADVRSEVIAWLWERMDGLLAAPFAVDFGREVLDWHRGLLTMGKLGTGRHWKPAPCPWCGLRTLYKTDGDDHVACWNPGPPACRCRLSMDDYHALVDHAARRNLEQAS